MHDFIMGLPDWALFVIGMVPGAIFACGAVAFVIHLAMLRGEWAEAAEDSRNQTADGDSVLHGIVE